MHPFFLLVSKGWAHGPTLLPYNWEGRTHMGAAVQHNKKFAIAKASTAHDVECNKNAHWVLPQRNKLIACVLPDNKNKVLIDRFYCCILFCSKILLFIVSLQVLEGLPMLWKPKSCAQPLRLGLLVVALLLVPIIIIIIIRYSFIHVYKNMCRQWVYVHVNTIFGAHFLPQFLGVVVTRARAHAIWSCPSWPSHDPIMREGVVKVGARVLTLPSSPTDFSLFLVPNDNCCPPSPIPKTNCPCILEGRLFPNPILIALHLEGPKFSLYSLPLVHKQLTRISFLICKRKHAHECQ